MYVWGQKKDWVEEVDTETNCEGFEFVVGRRDPICNANSLSIGAVHCLKPK